MRFVALSSSLHLVLQLGEMLRLGVEPLLGKLDLGAAGVELLLLFRKKVALLPHRLKSSSGVGAQLLLASPGASADEAFAAVRLFRPAGRAPPAEAKCREARIDAIRREDGRGLRAPRKPAAHDRTLRTVGSSPLPCASRRTRVCSKKLFTSSGLPVSTGQPHRRFRRRRARVEGRGGRSLLRWRLASGARALSAPQRPRLHLRRPMLDLSTAAEKAATSGPSSSSRHQPLDPSRDHHAIGHHPTGDTRNNSVNQRSTSLLSSSLPVEVFGHPQRGRPVLLLAHLASEHRHSRHRAGAGWSVHPRSSVSPTRQPSISAIGTSLVQHARSARPTNPRSSVPRAACARLSVAQPSRR